MLFSVVVQCHQLKGIRAIDRWRKGADGSFSNRRVLVVVVRFCGEWVMILSRLLCAPYPVERDGSIYVVSVFLLWWSRYVEIYVWRAFSMDERRIAPCWLRWIMSLPVPKWQSSVGTSMLS